MLDEFITAHREEIISRCKANGTMRSPASLPTSANVEYGVPTFLDELVDVLRLGPSQTRAINKTATKHGRDLQRQGFTVSEVVHAYGDICQAITGLAFTLKVSFKTDDFRTLNRCLDDAIAAAVTQFGHERDQSLSRERERLIDGKAAGETERLGLLARELRVSIHTASVALEVIKSGSVGIAGRTGTVLNQSLLGAHDLVERLLVEVYATRAQPDTTAYLTPLH